MIVKYHVSLVSTSQPLSSCVWYPLSLYNLIFYLLKVYSITNKHGPGINIIQPVFPMNNFNQNGGIKEYKEEYKKWSFLLVQLVVFLFVIKEYSHTVNLCFSSNGHYYLENIT